MKKLQILYYTPQKGYFVGLPCLAIAPTQNDNKGYHFELVEKSQTMLVEWWKSNIICACRKIVLLSF